MIEEKREALLQLKTSFTRIFRDIFTARGHAQYKKDLDRAKTLGKLLEIIEITSNSIDEIDQNKYAAQIKAFKTLQLELAAFASANPGLDRNEDFQVPLDMSSIYHSTSSSAGSSSNSQSGELSPVALALFNEIHFSNAPAESFVDRILAHPEVLTYIPPLKIPRPLIHAACSLNRADFVRVFLKINPDIMSLKACGLSNYVTPIYLAVKKGNLDVVRVFTREFNCPASLFTDRVRIPPALPTGDTPENSHRGAYVYLDKTPGMKEEYEFCLKRDQEKESSASNAKREFKP